MRIEQSIVVIGGRYHATIQTMDFTAVEEEKLRMFGEPLVEIGGDFDGSVNRIGQTNTVVTVVGDGDDAEVTPVLDAFGSIVSYTIVSAGTGYSAATITITGDGTGAAASATISSGAVAAVTPVTTGLGYHQTPVTVSFSLPEVSVRMRSDFPVKRVFDIADTINADAQAKLFLETISARLTEAKNQLMKRSAPLEGTTGTTV